MRSEGLKGIIGGNGKMEENNNGTLKILRNSYGN